MSSVRYKSVPQAENTTQQLNDEDISPAKTVTLFSSNIIRIAVLLIFALTLFDTVCILYLAISSSVLSSTPQVKAPQDIPFLSTYNRLDEIYSNASRKSTERPPIINTLRAVTYVDFSRPDYVHPLWSKRHTTGGGMVPFDERHVIITDTVSTVAEFHVMDYGMENCTIALTFPPVGSTSFQNSTVDVWLLESERGIDFSHLNWNSKPIRQLSLGTFVSIQNSTQQTMGYSCKTGTTQIIELSCRAVDCNIHVPAGGHDAIGLYVQQFQTI